VGAPPDNPHYSHKSNNKGRFPQDGDQNQGRDWDRNQNRNQQGASNGYNNKFKPKQVRDVYNMVDPETGNVERIDGFKEVPYKSETGRKREERRHKENVEEVKGEFILFNIPTRKNGIRVSKQSDNARVIKVLKELKGGGFILKNGDVTGTTRQVKNVRHPDFIPITVSIKTPEVTANILHAALIMEIANHRVPRAGDLENDRIGYIRRSLTHRERQSIKSKAEWRKSARGRAHIEIKKREEESTTSQEEWKNMELEGEEREVVTTPNEATNGGQQTGTHTSEPNKGETELAQAKNELEKMTAQLAKADKWRAEQEAINRDREDRIERNMEANRVERARRLAAGETENDVTQTADNASTNSANGC
jgi:hypothetical protein